MAQCLIVLTVHVCMQIVLTVNLVKYPILWVLEVKLVQAVMAPKNVRYLVKLAKLTKASENRE